MELKSRISGYIEDLKDYVSSRHYSRARRYLLKHLPEELHDLKIGIVLGSAQGGCIEFDNDDYIKIKYSDVPGSPKDRRYKAAGHEKEFKVGSVEDTSVIVANGRHHIHEGYDGNDIAFLVRLMKLMGVEILVLTNSAGGLNPEYEVGDLMLIIDHDDSSLPVYASPLLGQPKEIRTVHHLPQPYGGMYDLELTETMKEVADELDIPCHAGSYKLVTGPHFEPPKRTDNLIEDGFDSVGMSTVPEVIAVNGFLGLEGEEDLDDVKVVGIAGISNKMRSLYDERFDYETVTNDTSSEEVVESLREIGPRVNDLFHGFIRELHED